jgi:hypothetical protein
MILFTSLRPKIGPHAIKKARWLGGLKPIYLADIMETL